MSEKDRVTNLIAMTVAVWVVVAIAVLGVVLTVVSPIFFAWWEYWLSVSCLGVAVGSIQSAVMIMAFGVNRKVFAE